MNDNYYDTFIAVAEDCKVTVGTVPDPRGGKATVATMQYEMLATPFAHTQEQVLFDVWFSRQGEAGKIPVDDLAADEVEAIRTEFFAKGQPCLRASPLTKSYGWGVVFDSEGRAALCAMESDDYEAHLNNPDLTVVKAMRSKRA